ncbi:hypothetical protein JCM8208_002602 [Rhodotorula glutinis]
MEAATLYSGLALAPVAAYALAPAAPAFSVVVLIALAWSHVRPALEASTEPSTRIVAFLLPLSSLLVGSASALVLSNPAASATLSSPFDTFLAVSLFALVTSLAPLVAFVLGAAAFPRRAHDGYTAILVPALLFALAGIVQERAGSGRVGWWVAPLVDAGGAGLVMRLVGQVGVDVLVSTAGIALGEIVRGAAGMGEERGVVLGERRDGEDSAVDGARSSRPARRPLRLLALTVLVALVGPVVPHSSFEPSHPAPDHPRWTYPPLKVGCVVPPSLVARRSDQLSSATVDDWLAETRVVAGRGAKVLSWSEGAVRLEKGARSGSGEEGEDEEMGEDEKSLLEKVGDVCDMYKVYVLATYVVPPASSSSHHHTHKYLNVATLVGPRTSSSGSSPNLVWSTTKHHPVPFVESFSHTARRLVGLGSSSDALPLADVALPHAPHTPSPHRTPQQQLSVSGAICQDIAFPSLLSSYSSPHANDGDNRPPPRQHPRRTPQLLLNPSLVPPSLSGLGRASLAQARARALEHGAFVLRCSGGSGESALVGPEGEVRVLVEGEERAGSWEAEVALERASSGTGGTWFEWVGGWSGGGWLGAEGRWWLVLAAGVALVRLLEGGEAARWLGGVEWRELRDRVVERARSAGRRLGHGSTREAEGGARASTSEEERLIDVE